MATISRWVVPCYFTDEKYKTDLITFDLTKHLKQMLQNEVWNRKFNYGFKTGLKDTDSTDIEKATIKVFPRFISGYVNEARIPELIEEHCGKLPSHFKLKSYKEWSHHLGLVIIETEYKTSSKDIPSKKDLTEDIMPQYELGFIEKYHRHLAVLKELASFFLAGLHLSFPTESLMMRNDTPVNDGFFQILSGRQMYACKVATNAFMHEILIEKSKSIIIETNLIGLASVWHYDLWSLNRYLKAVESDQISIDNLLDLIFALEGLFEKSTSSEFVKTMCLLNLCRTKNEARSMKNLLDLAYRIRNDIAHGGLTFDPYDYVKFEGKDILAQTVYWKIKSITAAMLVKAISKLMNNKEMRNLRFNVEDLIGLTFQK